MEAIFSFNIKQTGITVLNVYSTYISPSSFFEIRKSYYIQLNISF